METSFSLNIRATKFDFINMNVTGPKLFQVFSTINGRRERYHIHLNESGSLEFAMPGECPKELLEYEAEISDAILQKYKAEL